MNSRKSQLAIFVIIALIIVAAIGLIVWFTFRGPNIQISSIESPQQFISDCLKPSLEDINQILLENNGFVKEPESNFILYEGRKVPYLCTVSEFYAACTPQEPMFLGNIRKEFEIYVKPEAESCFRDLKKIYERSGYDVNDENLEFDIVLNEDNVQAEMSKGFVVTKGEETISFSGFQSSIKSPINKLVTVAQQIVNYESTLCEFNYIKFAVETPGFNIKRFRASDQTKIYTIIDLETNQKLEFAIKTCLLPSGL